MRSPKPGPRPPRARSSWARLKAIAVSHPHYYGAVADWSDAFGGVPVYLHGDDRAFVTRPHRSIEPWSGDSCRLSDDILLLRCGGHFAGGTVLHWRAAADGRGALFTGDVAMVAMDRRSVSFMYSYPNYIPLNAPDAPTTTTPPQQDTPGTWLLDTTTPGPGLLAGSRRLTGELFEVQTATPDGTKLIGNRYREPGPHATATLEEISARTGKIIQTFGQCVDACGGGAETVLWSDPSGHQLVVAKSVKNPPPGPQTDVIGILKPGGTFTPLRPQPKAQGQIPGLTW